MDAIDLVQTPFLSIPNPGNVKTLALALNPKLALPIPTLLARHEHGSTPNGLQDRGALISMV
jgi:hypothetical protein